MERIFEYQITAAEEGRKIGDFLREKGYSRHLLRQLKETEDGLLRNAQPTFTTVALKAGDRIRVRLLETVDSDGIIPVSMPLSILYEDECFLAVDKPSGMLVHPSPQKNSGTLANGVLYHLLARGEASGVHPVTRLDRDTFGVVILAKNANIHDRFCRMLRERQLEKTYLASVFGQPPQAEGQIDLPVYKVGGGSLIRVVDARGQQALTRYRVLETAGQTALLELHPMTGRTHQLRLHCMASGFPILGDPQYTGPEAKAYSDAHGLQFQQLCAARLVFPHPMTGERIEICSKQTVFFPKD